MSPLTCSGQLLFSTRWHYYQEPVAEGLAFPVELSHGYKSERKGGCPRDEISPCLLPCMVKKRSKALFIPQPEDFKSAKINSMTKPCLYAFGTRRRVHHMIGKPSCVSVPRPKAVACLLLLCLSLSSFLAIHSCGTLMMLQCILDSSWQSHCHLTLLLALFQHVEFKINNNREWDEHVRILDTLFPEPLTIAGFDVWVISKNPFAVFL